MKDFIGDACRMGWYWGGGGGGGGGGLEVLATVICTIIQ